MKTANSAGPSVNGDDLIGFDALYHQYHNAVYANILKMVKQHEVAEDILQEVFLALWENRKKLDLLKTGGWLFVTSYNKSIKYLKKQQKEQIVPFEATPEKVFVQDEPISEELYDFQLFIVEEAVNHLPLRKKEVFRLCRYEGKSYDEVANTLGISVGSVKDYLKQSTRFIKEYVSKNHAESAAAIASMLFICMN